MRVAALLLVACAGAGVLAALALDQRPAFFNDAAVALLAWFVVGVLVALVFAVRRKWRRAAVALLVATISAVALVTQSEIGDRQEARAQERGDLLAQALESHKARTGAYPASLDQLTPRELPTVLDTGIGAWRKQPFLYSVDAEKVYSLGYPSMPFFVCWRQPTGEWECVE